MRISNASPADVMDGGHLCGMAKLTHPAAALPHLPPAFRVNRVTLPTPVRHRPQSSSSSIAAFNSSKSTLTISATSRIESVVPPARSHDVKTSTSSGGHSARDCLPHTSHHHTSRHGRRSKRVRRIGTIVSARHHSHLPLCATTAGSALASKFGFRTVGCDDRLKR
jgi:hypothetical protein